MQPKHCFAVLGTSWHGKALNTEKPCAHSKPMRMQLDASTFFLYVATQTLSTYTTCGLKRSPPKKGGRQRLIPCRGTACTLMCSYDGIVRGFRHAIGSQCSGDYELRSTAAHGQQRFLDGKRTDISCLGAGNYNHLLSYEVVVVVRGAALVAVVVVVMVATTAPNRGRGGREGGVCRQSSFPDSGRVETTRVSTACLPVCLSAAAAAAEVVIYYFRVQQLSAGTAWKRSGSAARLHCGLRVLGSCGLHGHGGSHLWRILHFSRPLAVVDGKGQETVIADLIGLVHTLVKPHSMHKVTQQGGKI